MPLNQDIEQSHRVPNPAFEIVLDTMTHFLEMTHNRQHRQDRFNHHAVIQVPLGHIFKLGGFQPDLAKCGSAKTRITSTKY
jgi:hypothetical protein